MRQTRAEGCGWSEGAVQGDNLVRATTRPRVRVRLSATLRARALMAKVEQRMDMAEASSCAEGKAFT